MKLLKGTFNFLSAMGWLLLLIIFIDALLTNGKLITRIMAW